MNCGPSLPDVSLAAPLATAFQGLVRQEVLSKAASRGYEGRQNRIKFKKDFEVFCQNIHSFLVLK